MASSATLSIFLSTNDVPTALEAATLQAEVDKLLAKISQLQLQVQACRGALSAVRRLPGEILGEIFIRVLPLTDAISSLDSKGRDSLIRLNLVCRRWREAAVMCHRLWSSVRAEGREISFAPITSWLGRAGSIPKRLEVVPEKKEKYEDEDEEGGDSESEDEDKGEDEDQDGEDEENQDKEEDEQESDMDAEEQEDMEVGVMIVQATEAELVHLLTHGVPLDHFGVIFSDPGDLKNLVKHLGKPDASAEARPWDAIRSFGLAFTEDYDLDDPNVLEPLLIHLPPSIESFGLNLTDRWNIPLVDESELLYDDPILHLPQRVAERLTSCSISCDWGAQHIFKLLEHCTNVETLTLNFKTMDGVWTGQYTEYLQANHLPQIKLPRLHTLRLRDVPPDVIAFLWHLETPVLTNLECGFVDDGLCGQDDYSGDLVVFLKDQSQCAATLKSLRLASEVNLGPEGLCIMLDSLPGLTHLAFDNLTFDNDEDFLDALKKRCEPSFRRGIKLLDPQPFLPNLRVLELIGQVGGDSFYQLSRFISLREKTLRPQHGGRLEELVVAYPKPVSPLSPLDLDSWERKRLKKGASIVNIHPLPSSLMEFTSYLI